jgi:hypothetical protein
VWLLVILIFPQWHHVHQPCFSTMLLNNASYLCSLTMLLNHAPQPYYSTMLLNHTTQPCFSTMLLNHAPQPYNSTMLLNHASQPCTLTEPRLWFSTMLLNCALTTPFIMMP